MMDNQCAIIFSTHATVYGSHSVMFAFIEERIFFFMCILNFIFFKFGLCVFIYHHLLNFPLNCFSYFYRGRSLSLIFVVHRGSCYSSQGELPLFFIELNCFLFPWFSLFSHVYCHSTLSLSCLCQHVTKRGRNK